MNHRFVLPLAVDWSTMRDFKFLKILDLFKPILEKLGIEYSILRKILQMKLIMDGRRVPTILNTSKSGSEEGDNKFLKSLGLYLLMGLILIPFVWMRYNYIFQMSIVYTVIIFFIMTSLISDFSSVLLDVKDKNIIGTKPVTARTIHLAKTLHIFYYMFSISAALIGPALIVSLYRQGVLFFLVFLVSIIFLDLLIIVLTSFIYLFVLRFFDGEKLKDIINYIQIILSIVISVGYQLFVRLFDIMNLEVGFVPTWWQFFIVPIWYSAPFQMIKKAEVNSTYLAFTLMTIVVPVIAFAVYIKLMPLFEKHLQKLNNNTVGTKRSKRRSASLLSKIICHSIEERIFFRFVSDMMKNEREFKLKVYPSLGFAIVFPYIFIFQQMTGYDITDMSQSKIYFSIYFCGIIVPTAMWMMRYSSNYKGAWIYKTVPLRSFVPVFRGTIKAFLAKLFFPLYLLQAITFLPIFGVHIIPELIGVFINILIFNLLSFLLNGKSLPFSEEYKAAQPMNGMSSLVIFAGLGIIAVLHYFISKAPFGAYIYIVLSMILYMILWTVVFPKWIDKPEKA